MPVRIKGAVSEKGAKNRLWLVKTVCFSYSASLRTESETLAYNLLQTICKETKSLPARKDGCALELYSSIYVTISRGVSCGENSRFPIV